MTNFIHTIEGALSKDACESLIAQFEKSEDMHGAGHAAADDGLPAVIPDIKISTDISIDFNYQFIPGWEAVKDLHLALNKGVEKYKKKFHTVDKIASWKCDRWWNIQRYKPGEGYYEWHCEAAGIESNRRIMAWMFYLNTIEEGGGTEFNYNMPPLKAVQGNLTIWPAFWTHYHRGIVAPKETKYIATGWFVYDEYWQNTV